jgi:hypothetical protein
LREGVNPTATPTGTGCVDCLAMAGGGYTSADALNVDKSAAAITLRTSMPQNTTRALAMPLSRASNTGKTGSTIIVREISLPGLSYQVPTLIP